MLARLLDRAPGAPGEAVLLAGEAVADSAPGGVTPSCRTQVVRAVVETMRAAPPVAGATRVAAGDVLARLGDPRFRADAWYLPDDPLLGFVEVPAGPFRMGSDKKVDSEAYGDETQRHEVTLPAYYIGRYPVTAAQFRAYVEDSGEKPEDADSLRGVPNHPVASVSWHEAVAYCRWLTAKLRSWEGTPSELRQRLNGADGGSAWQVTLPSEAEWEKAARGADGRIYPWGNEPDPDRANYLDTGIGHTSAVGCFPGGAGPYGPPNGRVEELSGNVLEWTRSVVKGYPYKSGETRENLAAGDDVRRVLRGGAFGGDAGRVRAASRHGCGPHDRFVVVGFRVVVSPFFL